jgi:hypothetical protein
MTCIVYLLASHKKVGVSLSLDFKAKTDKKNETFKDRYMFTRN